MARVNKTHKISHFKIINNGIENRNRKVLNYLFIIKKRCTLERELLILAKALGLIFFLRCGLVLFRF